MANAGNVDDTIRIWVAHWIFYSSVVQIGQIIVDETNAICIDKSRYTEGTGFGFITNLFKRVIKPLNNQLNKAIRIRFLSRAFGG